MTYQIDQSGKIEDTARNTVIAYSNNTKRAILITAKTKRRLQEAFRLCGAIRLFIYHTFAVGIFYLIEDLKESTMITIDTEYPGKDKIITVLLTKMLIAHHKPAHSIHFARIGNRPRVHYAAKDVFDGKKKADRMITFGGIMKVIKKTDGRLRECFETLVGAQTRPVKSSISKKKLIVKKNKKTRSNRRTRPSESE